MPSSTWWVALPSLSGTQIPLQATAAAMLSAPILSPTVPGQAGTEVPIDTVPSHAGFKFVVQPRDHLGLVPGTGAQYIVSGHSGTENVVGGTDTTTRGNMVHTLYSKDTIPNITETPMPPPSHWMKLLENRN
jgi:hypothetical protein